MVEYNGPIIVTSMMDKISEVNVQVQKIAVDCVFKIRNVLDLHGRGTRVERVTSKLETIQLSSPLLKTVEFVDI